MSCDRCNRIALTTSVVRTQVDGARMARIDARVTVVEVDRDRFVGDSVQVATEPDCLRVPRCAWIGAVRGQGQRGQVAQVLAGDGYIVSIAGLESLLVGGIQRR